ncbi:Fur family transcriptional regulator [Streptococcus dentiloxodontae]
MSSHHSLSAYEGVLNQLKSKGIRLTESRKAVIRYLMMSDQHPSAELIYRDLLPENPGMSLATVYNNLKVLIDQGLVSEIKVNKDNTTYYDFMGHDHLNVVCEKCGRIVDLDIHVPSFKETVEKETGYSITREQMTAYGVCPKCQ